MPRVSCLQWGKLAIASDVPLIPKASHKSSWKNEKENEVDVFGGLDGGGIWVPA